MKRSSKTADPLAEVREVHPFLDTAGVEVRG